MGALLRTELLTEVLSRATAELLIALGWRGTAVVLLATLVSHGLRRGDAAEAAPGPTGPATVNVACVATVLLALILLSGGD
jgi:hypothetical protein